MCLSVQLPDSSVVSGVSVARGNLVLTDHGQTLTEWFPGNPVDPAVPGIATGPRAFRFLLQQGPLSYRIPYTTAEDAATTVASLLVTDPQSAAPQIAELDVHTDTENLAGWIVVPTLLESHALDRHFVAETENDGRALIRFGDGVYGLDPPDGSHIFVTYRIGVGTDGNVGADSLAHLIDPGTVANFPSVLAVRNPLPAWGGTDPQPLEQIKQLAPTAFQAVQYRAVTEADYAQVAERLPSVSQAVATFRWTGSWYTVFITIDPAGRNDVPPELADQVKQFVTGFTQAGYDLEINAPVYVPLDIAIDVCVAPYHFRGDVEQALLSALSSRVLPDGSKGFFHPDNFSFGEPLYLSRLYTAILAVEGVDSASVTRFQRFGKLPDHELEQGYIALDRLEIARLDNDPNFPENGVLSLNMGGAK
jgi:predicted phage baseplate assembly protein